MTFRQSLEPRLRAAFARVDEWFAKLPKVWQFLEGDENLLPQLDREAVIRTLARAIDAPDAFWSRP